MRRSGKCGMNNTLGNKELETEKRIRVNMAQAVRRI